MIGRSPLPVSRRAVLRGGAALGVTLAVAPGRAPASEGALRILNWENYIGETTLATFGARTGIVPIYETFPDNEALYARLKHGNPGYDLIFPSDYMVEIMRKTGLLRPLDHDKIPNLDNVSPSFRNRSFDPEMRHSAPYLWGTMGFGYRMSAVSGRPDSWGVVFDDGMASEYSGRIALPSDPRAVIGGALKFLGYSLNSVSATEIEQATQLCIVAKRRLKTFADDNGQDLLLAREIDIALEWDGDIVGAMTEDGDLSYVVPREGSVVWIDNMCVPKGAPNPDDAHAFIDHVLDGEIGAEIADTIRYATPNGAARLKLDGSQLSDVAIYPPEPVIERCEVVTYVEDATLLYEDAWRRVQSV